MKVDLHNHTTLCNHASGSVCEYVQRACELGFDIYGFADHAPMNFDEKYRMGFSQMSEYERMINEARSKFGDKIEILTGYEVDFMRNRALIDERVLSRRSDYLIGSVHFLDNWGFDNEEFIAQWSERDIDDIYAEYFALICALCDSGKFDILGHFDLIKIFKFTPKKDIRILAREAVRAVKKSGITLELNAAGLRKMVGEIYPSDALLAEFASAGVDISFGCDAHAVAQVGFGYDELTRKARAFGWDRVTLYRGRDKELVKF
ncbi:histidinol-phosphatase [Campylobacter sp. VBCF_06 NA8]|uniref:histidinol-phosphatase n=1 Tax=Campylobacter sp. VBCF_06 NA8 TaxID=2983822 RepID=UPI0022E9B238|nr:histidinol-phosphatase [Campylobacter sp. VBCF_06 NA8]MDA3046048.1 histidinol-phosphatase [Campylobacter sp. VBCF_06 NA8]